MGIQLKQELNEFAIVSGSATLMPLNLKVVPIELCVLPRIQLIFHHIFLLFRMEVSTRVTIILLTSSTDNFS